MLYLVRAKPKTTEMTRFWTLLNDGTIDAQQPDGGEIVASIRRAVIKGDSVEWQETCYCSPPLRHERATVYDQFFNDIEIEPKAPTLPSKGESFWQYLENRNPRKGSGRIETIASDARYVPIRIL